MVQAILRAVNTGSAFVSYERIDVLWQFDLPAAVEAALMDGDHLLSVENAHGVVAGEHSDGTLHVGMGDAVVIQIEAYVGRFVYGYVELLFAREQVVGQSQ